MESLRRRVVITGLGIVCPIGNTAPAAWSALIAGKSGAGPISQFDTDGFPVRFACEVNDFDPSDFIDQKAARRMDRCTHLVVAAARQAQAGRATRCRRRQRAHRDGDRNGARWRSIVRADGASTDEPRPGPGQPVLDRADAPEPAGGLGVDRARHTRPVARAEHRLCRLEHGDRRRPRCDPSRPRGRDVLRRDRSAGDAGCARGFRRHARPLVAKRRPTNCVAPVRRAAATAS